MNDDRQQAIDNIAALVAQRDALVEAAIVAKDTGPGGSRIFVWRVGDRSGHEPTRNLARAAVLRAVGIETEGDGT